MRCGQVNEVIAAELPIISNRTPVPHQLEWHPIYLFLKALRHNIHPPVINQKILHLSNLHQGLQKLTLFTQLGGFLLYIKVLSCTKSSVVGLITRVSLRNEVIEASMLAQCTQCELWTRSNLYMI